MSDKDDKLRRELDAFVSDYNYTNKTNFKPTGVKGSRKRSGKGPQGHRQFGAVDLSAYGKSKKETDKFMTAMSRRGFRVIDEIDAKSKTRSKRNVIHVDSMREDTGNNKEQRGTIRKERRVKRKANNYPIQRVEKDQLYRSEMTLGQKESLKDRDKGFSSLMQGGQSEEVQSLPREKELTFKEKLQNLSKIDPEGSNTKENINAVLENDPNQLVPQITKDTPRLAMNQDQDYEGTLLERMRKVSQPPKGDVATAKKQREVENEVVAKSGQALQQQAGENILAQNPEESAELIAQRAPADSYEDVKRDLKARQTGAPRKGGATSQFTEALTFFLPQIIGGLAGAAIEGTDGAVAGVEQAGKMRDAFLSHKDKQLDREARTGTSETERRRLDIAEANLGLRKEKQTLDLSAETRRGKKLELDFDRFDLTAKQAGQLSGKQVDQLKDMNNVELSIDRIEELRKETNTGPLAGRVQSLAQWADAAPESFNKMKSQTASTLSNYVKSISGAQVAEPEAIRLQAVIPSINDAPEVFKDKLEEFKRIVQMNKKAFAQAIATGQPLKIGAIKGLLEAEKKFSKKKSSAVKSGFSREDIDAMKAKIRAERNSNE